MVPSLICVKNDDLEQSVISWPTSAPGRLATFVHICRLRPALRTAPAEDPLRFRARRAPWGAPRTNDVGTADVFKHTLTAATDFSGSGPVWTLCHRLREKNPAFGAPVIGGRKTRVGLNAVLGEDTADPFRYVGSAGAYEGQN